MNIFKFTSVLFFFLMSISVQVFTQDILYKKDSTILQVNVINFNGNTITYKIPEDSLEKIFYLSKSALDSLKYRDGQSLDFTDLARIEELQPKHLNRNYFNFQIINLLWGKLNFDYERISKTGRSSIVAGLFININVKARDNPWDGDRNPLRHTTFDPYYFFVRMGVNSYPFNSSVVRTNSLRFSTGLSVLLGTYRKEDTSIYNYPDGFKTNPFFATSLMWNITEGLYLGDHFQITGRIDTSILPFLTFLCPQLSLSFGF